MGRLEGASDKPDFKAVRPKTMPIASHCELATCRSVNLEQDRILVS